jgi:hypothetical protein
MILTFLFDLADLIVKIIALVIGGTWALYKIKEYREFKNWVQLDLDANIYRLAHPEHVGAKTWDKEGKPIDLPPSPKTHCVELLLKFTNKGRTRVRMFNIQVGINTMRPPNQTKFDKDDGHLHLTRIHTSGNIVPIFHVDGRPPEETSFYYIEPGVEQTVTYLCLIPEPRELLQVFAMFSLEQVRLFPDTMLGPKGLYPHTAARTFQLPRGCDDKLREA